MKRRWLISKKIDQLEMSQNAEMVKMTSKKLVIYNTQYYTGLISKHTNYMIRFIILKIVLVVQNRLR